MFHGILYNKKGQAVVEMALFGSLIIVIFATVIAYIQRSNDQQYVQMEAFRRGLQKANTYQGAESEGAGASVQYTMLENRKHVDLSGSFRKGSSQALGASSNVFWAVPKIGSQPENLIVYKVNADEKQVKYSDFVSEDDSKARSFQVEDTISDSSISFSETDTKLESPQAITNIRVSELQDTITTTIPYTIRENDDDSDSDNDVILEEGEFWTVTQGLYRDTGGQYKYSEEAVGTVVERGSGWETQF